jgi:hypothetical protein
LRASASWVGDVQPPKTTSFARGAPLVPGAPGSNIIVCPKRRVLASPAKMRFHAH